MGVETQEEYLVAKTESLEGDMLSIFFAKRDDRLAIPKKVLHARSVGGLARKSLMKAGIVFLEHDDLELPIFKPSSIEQVARELSDFIKTQSPTVMIVFEDTPEEIKETIKKVEADLSDAEKINLANFLGEEIITEPQKVNTWPSPYL